MTTNKIETLAEFVRRVRRDNEWSLQDVARQAGFNISDGYISMIENGKIPSPSATKLKALAMGLKVDPEMLSNFLFGIQAALSPDEQLLIAAYRQMDERAQKDALLYMQALRDAWPSEAAKTIEVPHRPQDHDISATPIKKVPKKSRKK